MENQDEKVEVAAKVVAAAIVVGFLTLLYKVGYCAGASAK